MFKALQPQPKIVLASSSTYRQTQLSQLGITFTCTPANINETALENEKPQNIALRLSIQKALAVAEQLSKPTDKQNYVIIGSDQTAEIHGKQLNKPLSTENAKNQLRVCSNEAITFYSGLAVYDTKTQTTQSIAISTEVKFRKLQENEIDNYVKADDPIYCAGSFKCESLGISLFDYIRSDDPSALIGLPLIALNKMLIKVGYNALENQID